MSYITHGHNILVDGKDIITNDMFSTYDDMEKERLYELLYQMFTTTKISKPHPPIIKRYAKYKPRGLSVPRFGLNVNFIDKRLNGKPITGTWDGTVRPEQKIVIDHLLKNIYGDNKDNSCTLAMEAGHGKTYVAAHLISHFKVKTFIVVHNTSMIEQWKDVLKVGNLTIGEYHSKAEHTDGDVVIGIVNSTLLKTKYLNGKKICSNKYFSKFGFTVFDEPHLYTGQQMHKVFRYANSKRMIGLSATPDSVLEWELGKIIDPNEISGYNTGSVKFDVEIRHVKYKARPAFINTKKNWRGDINYAQSINTIVSDPTRTSLIAECIDQLISENHNVLVFSDRIGHLKEIQKYFPESEIITDDTQVQVISGGASKEDLVNAEKNSQVVMTTYAYMGTGKSIPRMTAAVLATPRKSKLEQFVKRVCRIGYKEDMQRIIYDIHDTEGQFARSWYERKKYYRQQEMQIIDI